MLRFFLLIVLVCAVGLGVYHFRDLPGTVQVDLPGFDEDFPVIVAGLILLLIGAAIALFWTSIIELWNLPKKVGKSRLKGKERKANTALVEGLLAAEGGDAKAARKLAGKAAQHAADRRLVLLLEARAAEEAQDWSEAERAWSELRLQPGGELAGLKGMAASAIQRGDISLAERRNREALDLKSGAEWPFQALFDLQVANGDWAAALDTLAAGERKGLLKGDSLRRRRAVLLTAEAVRQSESDRNAAQRILADAIRAAPGFPPAAWYGAKHLISAGKAKAAQQILALGWKARPHPSLARLARTPFSSVEAADAGVQRARDLISAHPDHRESRILEAELALEAREPAKAMKPLAELLEAEQPTSRLCLIMAKALRAYGDRDEAERWQRLAATAARELDWSDLDARGLAFDYEPRDWSRLVYEFGDAARLIHPHHESGARQLEPGARTRQITGPASTPRLAGGTASAPPLDYVLDEDDGKD